MRSRLFTSIAVCFATLAIPALLHQVLYAQGPPGCPHQQPTTVTCPDSHPACAVQFDGQGQRICINEGSVLKNGEWDCASSGQTESECVTAIVPEGSTEGVLLCYTRYPCMWGEPEHITCIVNTGVAGQPVTKVRKIGRPCPGGAG